MACRSLSNVCSKINCAAPELRCLLRVASFGRLFGSSVLYTSFCSVERLLRLYR